jgi:hypothetical protein
MWICTVARNFALPFDEVLSQSREELRPFIYKILPFIVGPRFIAVEPMPSLKYEANVNNCVNGSLPLLGL